MNILLVGLNHQTAPVDVREQLAFGREGAGTALMLFRNQYPDCEASILSTCNRVELLVAAPGAHPDVNDVIGFLAQARDIPTREFRRYLYQLTGERATRHFFRVAGGLDSMVLGESQIVSQLKAAYALASEQGTTGRILNRLYHHAFAASKRVRTETGIGLGKVSVPSVAVDVARKIFADFADKQILVVGAGDMAQLVCRYLRDADARRFVVTSRTLLNAKALADACQGQAVPFDRLDEQLAHADVVIAATACPQPFLTAERIRRAQARRRGRLLFLIDLAVPRNVAPEAADLEQVYVYDIDALGKIVADTRQHRVAQLEACERILDAEVEEFEAWLVQARLNPIIRQMYEDAHEVGEAELERLFNRCPDMSPEQKKAVAQTVDRLVGKFMHPCVETIRRHSLAEPSATLAGELRAAKLKIRGGPTS